MSMSDFGDNRGGATRPRFEDRTIGAGNRDPWNNPVKQDTVASSEGGNVDPNKKKPEGIDDDVLDSIWQQHQNNNNSGGNNNNNNNNNNSNGNGGGNNSVAADIDPQEKMNKYLKGVGLDPITISDQEKEAMASGDFGSFIDKINQRIVNAHVKALSGSETMINAAVERAVSKTKNEMNQARQGEKYRDLLHEAMPWTKDPAISPVAQSVMQRFIDRQMSVDDALKGTKAYFDRMNNRMNNDSINKNRNTNFSSSHRNNSDSGVGEGGWLSVLTGQNR